MIPLKKWVWYGHAGHLCVADRCRFHLCTEVGQYVISTVGDYYLDGKRETIGAGDESFFETYVFNIIGTTRCREALCLCNMPEVDLSAVEGKRTATAGEATNTHVEMCEKYSRKKG
jgi:hypothetical protein